MCMAILITHLLFGLFALLESFKKITNFHILFLSSTEPDSQYFFNYFLTIQCICLHSTISAGYFFYKSVSSIFSLIRTYFANCS
jgi:hypothetical protein